MNIFSIISCNKEHLVSPTTKKSLHCDFPMERGGKETWREFFELEIKRREKQENLVNFFELKSFTKNNFYMLNTFLWALFYFIAMRIKNDKIFVIFLLAREFKISRMRSRKNRFNFMSLHAYFISSWNFHVWNFRWWKFKGRKFSFHILS